MKKIFKKISEGTLKPRKTDEAQRKINTLKTAALEILSLDNPFLYLRNIASNI